MSTRFVNRITLVSALSGALLALHLVLPLHAGPTGAVQANVIQQFGGGSSSAQTFIR